MSQFKDEIEANENITVMNKTLKSFFKNKKNQQLWFLVCPYKTYKIVGHLKELSSSIRLKKRRDIFGVMCTMKMKNPNGDNVMPFSLNIIGKQKHAEGFI